MVAKSDENVDTRTNPIANREAHIDSTKSTKSGSSTLSEANPSTMPGIGGFLKDRGLSQQAAELVLQSWREGTRKQYNPYIKRWQLYCSERQVDSISAPIEVGVNFLAELYDSGVGYSAVNTARSALSSYLVLPEGCQFGTHPLVRRVMKGVFETRPSLARYSATWDVAVVLRYLAKMHPADKLSLKDLTLKVVTLLALLSGQRRQTLHALKISCMVLTPDNCVFVLDKLLKTSKPGRHLSHLEFVAYTPDPSLCIVKYLMEYVKRTRSLRQGEEQLLVSHKKPYGPVHVDTVSRWIKTTLTNAGVNTEVFAAHSTRSASTSAASIRQIPLDTIMRSAGWHSDRTFQKFYNLPVENNLNYGKELLDSLS